MASSSYFAGTSSVRPQVRTFVDDAGLIPFQIGSPRIVALLGQATGGVPKTPLRFSTPNEARAMLRGGDLLRGVMLAFYPSTDSRGAQEVIAVRVAPTTGGTPSSPATKTFVDGAAADALVLTSVNYGAADNQIRMKVEAATIPLSINGVDHGLKLTLEFAPEPRVYDNVYRQSFKVQYVGAATTCTMTITASTLTLNSSTDSEDLVVQFASYPTIQAVAAVIDAHPMYEASVLSKTLEEPSASALDFVTAVDIKAAARTVTSDLEEVIKRLNAGDQTFVVASRATAAGAPPAVTAFKYLAGGSDGGAPSNGDWEDSFATIEKTLAAFVVPVSSSAAIHAMASDHCSFVSRDGTNPRRAFLGGPLGERTATLSNYLTRASDLNADRVGHVAMGLKGFDLDGAAIVYPPYLAAAAVAGLQAGVPTIGEPITHKSIRANGLEWVPTISDQEVLIRGGLITFEFVEPEGFYRIVRGVSTWRKNDAFHRVEISTGIALDEVVRAVTKGLDIFLGQKAAPEVLALVGGRTRSILRGLENAGIIVGDRRDNGTGKALSPAFSDIVISLDGDVVSVEFRCSPVVPLNFINVTIHADTFRSTFVVTVDQ